MILVINAGSSSLKFSLFDKDKLVKKGIIDRIGQEGGIINHAQAWENLYQSISSHQSEIELVVHRIVHGGEKYNRVTKLTLQVISDLRALVSLAPLHTPAILEVVDTTMTVLGNVPHLGIFDTGFFNDLPAPAASYPLPVDLRDRFQIKRYGFHGISHRYALRKAQEEIGMIRTQRMVSLHLGAGSSAAAIKEGVCIDTSMGFTPLEGLMMMTRAGDIDAGIILHLLKNGITYEELDKILNSKSGLYGISGISDDMRDLLYLAGFKVEDDKYVAPKNLTRNEEVIEKARLAIDMYVYRIAKYIGAYAVILGGLDALVFTGKIGAGSMEIRNLIVSYLNIFDNYELLVVEPDEEDEMVREAREFIKNSK